MNIFGIDIPLWLILVLLVLFFLYRWSTSTFDTFDKLGVPGPRPWPLLGTMGSLIRKGIPVHDVELFEKYGKVVGIYQGKEPILMIYDPEILMRIMVKDFSNFPNRSMKVSDSEDFYLKPPLDKQMIILADDHWKHVRNHLTPAFSGRKLRQICSQINNCAKTSVENLKEPMKSGDSFEARDFAGCFTMDAIASTAFNIDIDSKNNKENKFVKMATKGMKFSEASPLLILFFLCPKFLSLLGKYFDVNLFPNDSRDFFVDIVRRIVEDRKKNPDQNPKDFIEMMLASRIDDLKPEEIEHPDILKDHLGLWSKSGLTENEVVAQGFMFLLTGFDTTAGTLSFLMYNLALHPEAQDRVYQEILDVVGKQADPDYDQAKKLTYMHMCIDETLRLYPPGTRMDRKSENEIVIEGITIPKGMVVGIPIYTLHHNPEYWENPEQFIPERFSPEARANHRPYTFLPFGLGPRKCVAERFALLELKLLMVHVIRTYKLVTCDKTQIPVKLQKMKMESEKGIWLKVLPRE